MTIGFPKYGDSPGNGPPSTFRGKPVRWANNTAWHAALKRALRDGYFHEYWPVLLTDAVMQAGPPSLQEATIFNVESFFGWTLNCKDLIRSL